MAPSRLEFAGLSGSIATEPQSSIPIQLASLFYSSLAISTPSPQARASLIGVAIATGGNILISVALNVQKLSHMRLADQKSSSRPNSEVRNGNRTSNDDYHALQRNQSEREEEAISDGDEDGNGSGLDETAPLTPSPANRTYGGLDSNGQKSSNDKLPSLNNRIKANSTSIGSISNGRADLEGNENGNSKFKRNDRENSEEDFNHSSGPGSEFLRSRLWWFGISLMTLGEAGNFLSYGFAPASLVAPLGAVALLSNVLISPLLLGPQEKFSKSDFGGMLLATIGAVTVVFSSKESNARLGPDELLEAIKRLEFFIYAGISAFFAAILMLLSRTRLAERFVLIDVGVCALFGGFTVLSTKGLSSLLAARHPLDVIKYPITYVLLVILASTAVAQITYLNRALFRFDSREVIPTQFVFFTISAIVGSAVLYRDFENVEPHRFINFIFGCLTTFAGVFILTRSRGSGSEAADEEGEEVSDSTTPSPISTPKKRGRRRTSRAGSQSSKYLQIPDEDGSQELDLDPSRAVKVDILTPVTPTSEAEREDALTPLVSTSLKPSHPGMISSMTTGSVPLSSSGSRRPRPSKSNQKDLSGSLPSSSTTPTLNETANAFNRNHRLSFPGPRSSPRTTPGLGFSAGHYLLLATPSGSNSNSQGLLVPLDSTGKSGATRHVRTRSQSTPGNRRRENERDHQRRNREESSEGNVGNSRAGDGQQQQDGSSQADESQEIGDLEMDFEEDQSPKRRSTRERDARDLAMGVN